GWAVELVTIINVHSDTTNNHRATVFDPRLQIFTPVALTFAYTPYKTLGGSRSGSRVSAPINLTKQITYCGVIWVGCPGMSKPGLNPGHGGKRAGIFEQHAPGVGH